MNAMTSTTRPCVVSGKGSAMNTPLYFNLACNPCKARNGFNASKLVRNDISHSLMRLFIFFQDGRQFLDFTHFFELSWVTKVHPAASESKHPEL